MKEWINRLFHVHQYKVEKKYTVENYLGGSYMYDTLVIVQRCSICGKIEANKIKLK